MSTIDGVVLVLIIVHSLFRVFNPAKGKEDSNPVWRFFATFFKDVLIYFVASFIIGMVAGLIGFTMPFVFLSQIGK